MRNLVNSLLDTIGNTPLVRLNALSNKYDCDVYGKIESFNPSMSIKDRIVHYIVKKAEKDGDLKPGMTIVDATSGNTGLSIALIALIKGYKCILTVKDSSANAKIDQLLLYGARVIKCPAKVSADDPLSYYSVAKKFAKETPNTFYLDQNFNQNHYEAHKITGKEIWDQTDNKISHFFASASTGGSISGIGSYLKSKDSKIKVICADSKGSVLKPYHEEGRCHKELKKQTPLEGVGKDIIPSVFRPEFIDECIEVGNESSIQNAKDLLLNEGVFAGGSSGAAIDAFIKYVEKYPDEKFKMVIINFPDHGLKYIGKLYEPEIKAERAVDL